MRMKLKLCEVRSLNRQDAPSLALHANNRKIWLNLRDLFPHPYTLADARRFIRESLSMEPESRYAIVVDGQAVGVIGVGFHGDVERVSAEIGYWLGEPFWGRGIMTEALIAMTDYIMKTHALTRLYALPFSWNTASCRVLEKAEYQLEGRMRRSAIKDGKIIDQFLYAYVAPD